MASVQLHCFGRLERGEQCLECCLVGSDERGCLRREPYGLEQLIVRLRSPKQSELKQ
jgi:hypothetical protein